MMNIGREILVKGKTISERVIDELLWKVFADFHFSATFSVSSLHKETKKAIIEELVK